MIADAQSGHIVDAFARFSRIYGFAHFGKSLFWYGSELLFAFYLTEICGLAPRIMAIVLMASMLGGALADICVGKLLSDRVTDLASAVRMQRLGAIASGGALMFFAGTAMLSEDWRLTAVAASLFVFRLGYAFFDVPQNAILILAATDDPDHARLSSVRFLGSGLAAIVIAILFAMLIEDHGQNAQALHFAWLGLLWAVTALAGAFWLPVSFDRGLGQGALPDVPGSTACQRRTLMVLLITILVFSMWSSLFNKLQPYIEFPQDSASKAAGILLIAAAAGTMAGQPLWLWLARSRSSDMAMRIAAAALAGVGLIFLPLAQAGMAGLAAGGLLYGIAWGGVAMALWALLARHGSNLSGFRATTITGIFTFCSKLGTALAVPFLAEILEHDGEKHRLAATWADGLWPMMALLPVAAALSVIPLCWRRAATMVPNSA